MSAAAERAGETVIALDDRLFERAQLAQSVPDLMGAIMVAQAAVRWLQLPQPLERAFGVVGLAVGAAVVVAFVRELWRLRSGERHDSEGWLEWMDLLVGATLILSVLHNWSEGGRIFRPDLMVGVALIAKSVLHPWLRRRLGHRAELRMDDSGLRARLNPFRGFDLRWSELAGVQLDERAAVFTTRAGKNHRLRLRRFGNRDEILSVLRARLSALHLIP